VLSLEPAPGGVELEEGVLDEMTLAQAAEYRVRVRARLE
jgi:hypothetical protein